MNKISIVTKEKVLNFNKTTKTNVAKKITKFIYKLSL